jgi:cobalamin biosynthesis protein CobT
MPFELDPTGTLTADTPRQRLDTAPVNAVRETELPKAPARHQVRAAAIEATASSPVDWETLKKMQQAKRRGKDRKAKAGRRDRAVRTPLYRVFSTRGDKVISLTDAREAGEVFDEDLSAIRDAADRTLTWLQRTTIPTDLRRVQGRAAVTMLVDCSGSMTNHGRWRAAGVTVEVLATALENAGIACEVLGYSVVRGKVHKQFKQRGRHLATSRVGELRHFILKPYDEPAERGQLVAGLTQAISQSDGNIDGEALHWAYERIRHRSEAVRTLLVLTDGNPAGEQFEDHHTGWQAKSVPYYFSKHLQKVAAKIDRGSDVALMGVGLAEEVDLTSFYPSHHKVEDLTALDREVLSFLGERVFRRL